MGASGALSTNDSTHPQSQRAGLTPILRFGGQRQMIAYTDSSNDTRTRVIITSSKASTHHKPIDGKAGRFRVNHKDQSSINQRTFRLPHCLPTNRSGVYFFFKRKSSLTETKVNQDSVSSPFSSSPPPFLFLPSPLPVFLRSTGPYGKLSRKLPTPPVK